MLELHVIEIELERLYQKTLIAPLNVEDTKKFETLAKLKVLITASAEASSQENPFDGQTSEVLKQLFAKISSPDEN